LTQVLESRVTEPDEAGRHEPSENRLFAVGAWEATAGPPGRGLEGVVHRRESIPLNDRRGLFTKVGESRAVSPIASTLFGASATVGPDLGDPGRGLGDSGNGAIGDGMFSGPRI